MKQLRSTVAAFSFLAIAATTFTSCSEDAKTMNIDYAFNTGQVGAGTEYSGTHPTNLTAKVTLTEDGDQTKVKVELTNTLSGQDYNIHVHDAADPGSTPNGTPYNESPNASILVMTIAGNGGTISKEYTSTMSYTELTENYAGGFFVVHDPTQALSTTNLQTYLVVGAFLQ